MRRYVLVVIALLTITGCGFDISNWFGPGPTETDSARLQPFTSPDELRSYLVGQTQRSAPNSGMFGDMDMVSEDSAGGSGLAPPPTAAPEADGAGDSANLTDGGRDYSTTTEQEEGVQEADIIKNDGAYLYVLSRGVLRIVKATPADAIAEVGSLDLAGYGVEMYLVGDQVVAITVPNTPILMGGMAFEDSFAPDFAYYRPQAEVAIIDVTDRTEPKVAARVQLDGSIHTSRMIDSRLHMVAVNYPDVFAQPLLMRAKAASFAELSLDDMLPDIAIEVDGVEVYQGNIAEYDQFFRPIDPDGLGLTSIVTLDVNDPAKYAAQTVVAYPANVYASVDALYLTDADWTFAGDLRETTDIYKFAFTATGVTQTAAGTVPGRVLNQYSMSEYDGYLRVATTVGPTFGMFGQQSESKNAVYVLQQAGDALEVVGSVEGLAPGESIYSARFVGPRGYLVTFRQIDPLFTVDLSDPRNPRAAGRLKVPGFSTFIVPMGPDHLLTIGQDTNDEFGWTFAQGVRVSIFDVSDFANPKLAHYEVIGTNGAWSEALYNPKAFTYFAAGDLLAFPVEIYDWSWDGGIAVDDTVIDRGDGNSSSSGAEVDADGEIAGTNGADSPAEPPPTDVEIIDIGLPPLPPDYFRGLYVYRVTADAGFELLGRMSTINEDNPYYYYGPEFTRGAFIGDAVYAITSDSVSAAAINDVSAVLSTVSFPAPDYGWYEEPVPEPGVIVAE